MAGVLAWGVKPGSFCLHCMLDGTGGHFQTRKLDPENGVCSHVPRDRSRHGPPTTLNLGSEDAQIKGAYVFVSFNVIGAL